MKRNLKGLVGLFAIGCVLAATASGAAANSILSTTGPSAPLPANTPLQLRAVPGGSFIFNSSRGTTITCNSSYSSGERAKPAALGELSVLNPEITSSELRSAAKLSKLKIENEINLSNGAAYPCRTTESNWTGCRASLAAAPSTVLALAREEAVGGARSIALRFSTSSTAPLAMNVECFNETGNYPCVYNSVSSTTSGAPVPALATAPFSTTAPVRAGTFSFSKQAFLATSQSVGCGITGRTLTLSGSFNLFTPPSASPAAQVFAWDKSAA